MLACCIAKQFLYICLMKIAEPNRNIHHKSVSTHKMSQRKHAQDVSEQKGSQAAIKVVDCAVDNIFTLFYNTLTLFELIATGIHLG